MRGTDWWPHHVHIDPIDTADALTAALADPQLRWYGLRRMRALIATGTIVAASTFEAMHPRGRDGKFIERFGWVRWFDPDDMKWHSGWVSDIDPNTGNLTIRSDGDKLSGVNPKTVYAKPKPKARINLPDPTDLAKQPSQFAKTGGQGGSNPGGMYKVVESFASDSPDLSNRSAIFETSRALRQPGTPTKYGSEFNADAPDVNGVVPNDVNTVVVPRLDGTQNRYDVLTRFGPDWYRVPASGTMTTDDLLRPELKVDPADAFGQPGTARRHAVVADLGTQAFTRGQEFDVEDVAAMFQGAASPMPQVGDSYYVKKMNIPERARNEALANDFYEVLGIPVPDVAVGKDGTTISSKLVGNTTAFDPNNPAHVAAAQEGFVADAWLSNWDVIGLTFDNIQIDGDGRAWRIDAGGALAYRAQGKPKGPMFGDNVGELTSLRQSSVNPQSAKVYGGITDAQLKEQAKVLQSITPAQIETLAAVHDMPELGPVLVARRKSILDQLGIVDPPPNLTPEPPTPPAPKMVFNPVEAVQQMGTAPTVAVGNWNQGIAALSKTTFDPGDWSQPGFVANHVLVRDGDLWMADGPVDVDTDGTHTGLYRNVFTDERLRMKVTDGADQYLSGYTGNNIDTLVDTAGPTRDLAVAEIVARTAGTPINQLSFFNVNEDGDPDRMRYQRNGLVNFNALGQAIERGRLGPTGAQGQQAWPIYNGDDDTLWEITAHDGTAVKLTRRGGTPDPASWKQDLILLDATNFAQNGPWFIPGNDTTANIWLSKYTPDEPAPTGEPDGANWDIGDDVTGLDGGTYKIQGIVDDKYTLTDQWGSTYYVDESFFAGAPDDAPDVPSIGSPGADDGISDIAGVPDVPTTDAKIAGSTDADVEALIASEEAIAAQVAAAQPTGVSQKVTNDVLDGLGGGEPVLSTEMALADLDKHQQMVGKSVVVLPIEAHDNPDWEATKLGTANGLGTVIAVEQKEVYNQGGYTGPGGAYVPGGYTTVVAMKVQKAGSTKFSWVVGGENAKFKKVIIPVETEPVASVPTFKQNGDVFINGEKVGTFWKPYAHPAGTSHAGWSQYTAVIDGDHSITGKPMHVQANKQADLKIAANAVAMPIAPKPTKPKSGKVHATEDEIKALNSQLATVGADIGDVEQQLEDLAKAKPASGNPLNDGSQPQKGDWVFSTKDGSYAQVLNPVVVGFAGKGVTSPDMVKVKLQDPVTGKWKQSNRKRDTLVSAAGPGETPFVMQTKAKQAQTGDWFGPGSQVTTEGGGGKVTVLDTTSDGNVKILAADGAQYWTPDKQVIGIAAGTGGSPTLKAPAVKSTAGADDLNAQLGILNAQHAKLAATIANTVLAKPKKKKEIGTPFPGPAGMTVKQPASLAEARTAKGLKNTKDNYVPTPGMILRHNDGTQYVVYEMGTEWSSHKNSVNVVPVGGSVWDAKWRAVSTLTVDHEAMLTDKNGDPLPIISEVEGTDWTPSGMLIRKDFTKSYQMPDPTGAKDAFGSPKLMYRQKEVSKFYVVAQDGTVYNLDGTQASAYAIQPGMPTERVGYIDKDHPNGKKLTVSIQQHHNASVGQIEYAVIHDPSESAGIPVANQHAVATPTTPTAPAPPTPTPAPAAPNVPPAPNVPTVPPAAPSAPNIPTPTAELPVYAGKDPTGKEMPHPPTTSSSKGVPAMQPTAGPATLDVVGVPGAHSVTNAIGETITKANNNKGSNNPEWVGTYGMADHDVIEDMLVQTQVVRDAQGNDYVEVRFRVEADVARSNHTTLITSTTNETGDWKHDGRNATNLVVGDYMAVRVSGGGGATVKGALRPDGGLKEGPKTPNAQVIAPPVLIGKNAAGTFDVYRTQVMTAGGDIGFIDLEDRSGVEPESLYVSTWDPTIPRTSNGAKGLNPNAANDGWQVKSKQLQWDRADSGSGSKEQYGDGVKKDGNGYSSISTGSGWTLQRDFQGAHVEYRTTDGKNSLDGQVSIRVPLDDPAAQQKIADAMELVGVTKEAQKPPDRDAVIKLATDKVWEQFNPTWTKGKRPNSPQQALDAIDAAVGPQLGRKATMDDISIRVTPDGRVQVLVSEDVSRAIVKKNGIKHYTHRFSGGSSMENTVVGAIQGENPGLMSTTERWSHGLFYQGMSSVSDHGNDAAGFLFLRMSKSSSVSSGHAVIDAVTLHRHVDYYWQPSDSFGKRQSNQLNWLNDPSAGGSNELMLQRRLEVDLWSHVVVDAGTRQAYIAKLHKQGVTHAPNGTLLEDFFVTTGGTSALAKTPPKFGDEIPLSSLPDTLPAATAVAPAAVPALAGV